MTGNIDPGAPDSFGDDLPEADIDLEWSGATARNAQIIYVNAPDPSAVASMTPCTTRSTTVGAGNDDELLGFPANSRKRNTTTSPTKTNSAEANSQGITFRNSSGDTGAAECDYGNSVAVWGYAAGYPASSPSITGVGGTLIPWDEYTATYWGTTNGTDGGSALQYIPESVWNDAQEWSIFARTILLTGPARGIPASTDGKPRRRPMSASSPVEAVSATASR